MTKSLADALAEIGITTEKVITTGVTPLVMNDTVWEDLTYQVISSAKLAGKEPVETAYKGGVVLACQDSKDEGIAMNIQTAHSYKLGTDIKPHIHVALPTAGAGAGVENIKFDFTYSIAGTEEAFAAETTISVTVDVQNYAADTHFLIPLGTIPGTSITKLSTIIICSVLRDVSVTDNYADDVYLLANDSHIERDALGSDQELVKFTP